MTDVPVLLTQVRLSYFTYDCGGSYVLRLKDSRFVIFDGGCADHGEEDHLFELLTKQNERTDGITVAAWLFSHAHDDHIGCFLAFLDKYASSVTIEKLVFDFPIEPEGEGSRRSRLEFLRRSEAYACVTPERGQCFDFPGARVEVVSVGRDLPEIKNFNDTSTVYRVTAGEHKVMMLGDVMPDAARWMVGNISDLAADTVTLAHHGYWGGSDALYRAIDPETVLLPTPDYRADFVRTLPQNQFLFSSPRVRQFLEGGRAEYTLELSGPYPIFGDVYRPFAPGERPVDETFPGKRICELGWACVTGGQTGYRAADASLSPEGLVLSALDRRCVLNVLQPGQARLIPHFTFEFSGTKTADGGSFGLWWDYGNAIEFDSARVVPLPEENGPFAYRLVRDENGVRLYKDGKKIKELPDSLPQGLYLILENTGVTLSRVSVTAEK